MLAQGATPLGVGVQGIGGGNGGGNGGGVYGVCNGDTGYGVSGNGTGANGTGVSGIGNGSGAGVLGGGGLYGVKGIVGNSGYGVHGTAGIGFGVYGTAPTGAGVGGDSGNIGVQGRGGGDLSSNTTGAPIGARGSVANTGFGVYGAAGNGSAVYGTVTGGNGTTGVATTGNGVVGSSTSGYGVVGSSGASVAVYGHGTGAGSYGVLATAAPGAIAGVYATSATPNTPAFYAVNFAAPNPPNSNVGFFIGQVYINAPLVIAGGAKSAAVPHPDGTHRLLYCVESPEAWFEDFGEGTITGGKAEVKLDHGGEVGVDTAKLHVFPVSHNETHHLAVKATSSMGSSVAAGVSSEAAARGVKASDVSGTFTYRVVAKRKDVAAPRFAKFEVPKALPTPTNATRARASGRDEEVARIAAGVRKIHTPQFRAYG